MAKHLANSPGACFQIVTCWWDDYEHCPRRRYDPPSQVAEQRFCGETNGAKSRLKHVGNWLSSRLLLSVEWLCSGVGGSRFGLATPQPPAQAGWPPRPCGEDGVWEPRAGWLCSGVGGSRFELATPQPPAQAWWPPRPCGEDGVCALGAGWNPHPTFHTSRRGAPPGGELHMSCQFVPISSELTPSMGPRLYFSTGFVHWL